MAHQLYVLQVLTFNLLEDRMMTKMDPQDQVSIWHDVVSAGRQFITDVPKALNGRKSHLLGTFDISHSFSLSVKLGYGFFGCKKMHWLFRSLCKVQQNGQAILLSM